VHTISRGERLQAIAFLTIGVLLIGGVCGLLIGVPLLRDTRQYFVVFNESIGGIEKGSDVRYMGVKKGRVKKITIRNDVIQLELEIEKDLRITEATQARISSDGFLPPFYVELRGSVPESSDLAEGSIIRTDPSTTSTLMRRGMAIADRFEAVLHNIERWTGPDNEAKLVRMLDEATSAVATANQTMTTLRPEAERLMKNYADSGEELTKALAENREALHAFLQEGRKAVSEVNRFLESGKLDQMTGEASRTFESMRNDFTRATDSLTKLLDEAKVGERLQQIVAALERAQADLGKMSGVIQTEVAGVTRAELAPALASFKDAMHSLQELSRVLRNDPSLILFSKPRSEIQIPRPGDR
jgi:phospholipid/cholesterol/gamma-HCH transport system substrate-binding protein